MPFCEPDIATSTPQASMSNGMQPSEATASTMSSASCPAARIAWPIAGMSLTTPDAVSICATSTALIVAALVGLEPRLDLGRPHGAAHVAFQDLDLDAHAACALAPADGEAAALQHQDPVALGQHVGERGLPGAVAVGDVDVGAALWC